MVNNTTKKRPSGYWNYETCYQEAKKYKSRKEFEKGCERIMFPPIKYK